MSRYDVKSIASSNLPVGATNKPPRTTSESASENRSVEGIPSEDNTTSAATSLPFPSQNSSPAINFGLPLKPDQSSSLWAALGYPTHPPRNPSNSTTMFQEGTTPYSTEFDPAESNNGGFFNGRGYYQQECEGTTASSSGTTRMVSNGTSHDAAGFSNNGSWIPQAVHAFQDAKTNLTSFQTPIFGIE